MNPPNIKGCRGVKCPYLTRCTDAGSLCSGCANNTGRRSYYREDPIDYIPYVPYVPYQPYWVDTWGAPWKVTCGDSSNIECTSYYRAGDSM